MLNNLKWFPWQFIVRSFARKHGFIDPLGVLAKLRGFAQPSEISEPLELLRAGVIFHARGLMNTRAIQHNLDWVWPYWVERQFDPRDPSFIPRAFSVTHVNLTHRNWTAVGVPDLEELVVVDPRGLVMPIWDGWCLDAWIVERGKFEVLPSRLQKVEQFLRLEDEIEIETRASSSGAELTSTVSVETTGAQPLCTIDYTATVPAPAWLVVSLRPYNPEGVSFIHDLTLEKDSIWRVDGKQTVHFDRPVERHLVSNYRKGDVYYLIRHPEEVVSNHQPSGSCDIGMLTAAAMFRVEPGNPKSLQVTVPIPPEKVAGRSTVRPGRFPSWKESLSGAAALKVPDKHHQFLYDAALRTLVLHAPGEVYPGPYTYKRFWFRDAAFMISALLRAGFHERASRTISQFFKRQTRGGYFLSQEGEWDSNGEALWSMSQYVALTGKNPPPEWRAPIIRGAQWIIDKRVRAPGEVHDGLFPAGFSAEHLGLNDYYFWDDFWGVAGLRSAAMLLERLGDRAGAERFTGEAEAFAASIASSIEHSQPGTEYRAIPASPHRRMDAGAIGSLATSYPLLLSSPDDALVLNTVRFLEENCFDQGAFFQDMIHSGVNAYLTLHVAQVLLRAGNPGYAPLVERVAEIASPTGQWPEAIHPQTLGGCMGDGQHAWAAAEWIIMIRNCFIREESDTLLFASGILPRWLEAGEPMSFGPSATPYGPVTVSLTPLAEGWRVDWSARFRAVPRAIEVRLPGHRPLVVSGETGSVTISPLGAAA